MSPTVVAVVAIVFLIILFLLQMPVAFAMALVGFLGFIYVGTVQGGLNIVATDFWVQFSSYSLTVIPLFVFMGVIASYSGASRRLYDTAYKFVGRVRGGLALATILACAGFGAMCGSTNAAAAAMGKVTLPQMRRFHYDDSLATACVAAGGSLAVLIPPSTIFMVYGILTEQSIGKLFVAGVFPGLLLTALFAIAIAIRIRMRPAIAPAGPKTTLREMIASLPGALEMLGLFGLVTGGLIIGWFTPTEAGAVGAAGALVVGLIRRGLSWRGFVDCLADTTRITAMVFLIVTGATLFGHFMSVTRLPFELTAWVGGLDSLRLSNRGVFSGFPGNGYPYHPHSIPADIKPGIPPHMVRRDNCSGCRDGRNYPAGRDKCVRHQGSGSRCAHGEDLQGNIPLPRRRIGVHRHPASFPPDCTVPARFYDLVTLGDGGRHSKKGWSFSHM
jgi:C4-dicarboxylate transporter DctM subunit